MRLKLLIIFMAINCCIFSQTSTLKPIVQVQGSDTVFVFTINQSKFIAKSILNGMYCDSLLLSLSNQIQSLNEVNKNCEGRIAFLKQVEFNSNSIIQNNLKEVDRLNKDLNNYKRKLNTQSRISGIIILVLATFLIIK